MEFLVGMKQKLLSLLVRLGRVVQIQTGLISDIRVPIKRDRKIPNTVFQTGETRRTDLRHLKAMAQFRTLNDDLSFTYFDAPSRDAYMMQNWSDHPVYEVYTRSAVMQMRADIFRYCIIFDRGGYYLDINKAFMVRFSSLHQSDDTAFISFESNDSLIAPPTGAYQLLKHPEKFVVQSCFGFSSKHPILERVINQIASLAPPFFAHVFENPKNAVLMLSGPPQLTYALHWFLSQVGSKGIAQVPVDYNHSLIFRLPGSSFRGLKTASHYSEWRNRAIFHDPVP